MREGNIAQHLHGIIFREVHSSAAKSNFKMMQIKKNDANHYSIAWEQRRGFVAILITAPLPLLPTSSTDHKTSTPSHPYSFLLFASLPPAVYFPSFPPLL